MGDFLLAQFKTYVEDVFDIAWQIDENSKNLPDRDLYFELGTKGSEFDIDMEDLKEVERKVAYYTGRRVTTHLNVNYDWDGVYVDVRMRVHSGGGDT